MDSVPVHANSPAPVGRGAARKPKFNKKRIAIAIAALLLVAIVAMAGWMLYRSSTAANIDRSKYQAVFFTNGQVYFGKLQSLNGGYMKLEDIYYLQAQATAAEGDSENPQQTTDQGSDVQLIKLGNEVHGPVDEMVISKDQILFFENLKKDGKVSQSIAKYQSEQK